MGKLYKGKYIIAVYDEDDEWLLAVVDNPDGFAKWLGVEPALARSTISKMFNGSHSHAVKNGRKFKLHFFAIGE